MTTVARRDPADKAKIDAIEKKLLANPDIAKLIDDLGTSTTDANDLVRGMLQASITRGLNAEMDAHLGYESGDRSAKAAAGTDNHRNGSYPKTVDSNYGPVTVDVPRDRAGTFLPTMVPKGSRRLTDVDDMIVSLYAGGMTIRDIQHHMATAMRVDISHETISAVTDAVLDEVEPVGDVEQPAARLLGQAQAVAHDGRGAAGLAGRLALDMVIQVENLHQHAHLVVRQQATLIGRQIGGRQFAGDHSTPPLNSQLSTCRKSQDALHMRPASRFTPDI